MSLQHAGNKKHIVQARGYRGMKMLKKSAPRCSIRHC